MNAPLLIDVSPLSELATDCCLEDLAKALAEEPGDEGIWAPHESLFIQQLIEQFTAKGLLQIDAVKAELQTFLAGDHYNSAEGALLPDVDGFAARWTARELAVARLYLESLPVALYTLHDYGLLIEYLMQRYLPKTVVQSQAEALAVKSALMGRVQANLALVTAQQAGGLAAAMPASYAAMVTQFQPEVGFKAAVDYAQTHACEQVVSLTDSMRHALKQTVWQELATNRGDPALQSRLQTRLQDQFAQFNRDWRRIAVTEAGEAANQGVIASLKPGTRVKRLEVYAGACPFCKKIDGAEMTVLDPDAPSKDWKDGVWVGKNNVGRSMSPRKRVGSILVHREPEEMWAVPAGLVHPHCRGRWHVVQGVQPSDNPAFAKWLDENL